MFINECFIAGVWRMENKFAIRKIVSLVLLLASVGMIVWTVIFVTQTNSKTDALVAKWNEMKEHKEDSASSIRTSDLTQDGKLVSARLLGMRVAEFENDYIKLYDKYRIADLNHTLNDYDMDKLVTELAALESDYNVYCGERCLGIDEWILLPEEKGSLTWEFCSNYNLVGDTSKTVVWLGYQGSVLWGFVTATCDVERGLFTDMVIHRTLDATAKEEGFESGDVEDQNLFASVLHQVVDKYDAIAKSEEEAAKKAEEERLKAEEEERQRQESEQAAADAEAEAQEADTNAQNDGEYAEDVYSPDTSNLPEGWDDGIIIE